VRIEATTHEFRVSWTRPPPPHTAVTVYDGTHRTRIYSNHTDAILVLSCRMLLLTHAQALSLGPHAPSHAPDSLNPRSAITSGCAVAQDFVMTKGSTTRDIR